MTYNPPPPGSPGQPQYPGGTGTSLPARGLEAKGFVGALFDFSFAHFVTPLIIRTVYVLGLVGIALSYLMFVIIAFQEGAGLGLITVLLGLIIALVYLAFWRVTLEFFLAVVRMSEDIHNRGFPGGR